MSSDIESSYECPHGEPLGTECYVCKLEARVAELEQACQQLEWDCAAEGALRIEYEGRLKRLDARLEAAPTPRPMSEVPRGPVFLGVVHAWYDGDDLWDVTDEKLLEYCPFDSWLPCPPNPEEKS